MAERPKRRCLFLDTEVFVANNFEFAAIPLRDVATLVSDGALRLLSTTITNREVEARIRDSVNTAASALKHFRAEATILRNVSTLPFKDVMIRLDRDAIIAELNGQFASFCKRSNANVLKFDKADPEPIFHSYFLSQPPFGTGTKKYEFPDAFAISILKSWAIEQKEKIHVVSGDPDWKAACDGDRLQHYERLSDFLDSVTREFKIELYSYAEEAFAENKDTVEDAIKKTLEDASYYLRDEEGDVDEVSVSHVDNLSFRVISVSADYATYEVSLRAEIKFEVAYDDPNMTTYDHEEGRYYVFDQVEETLDRLLYVDVEIGVSLDPDNDRVFDIDHASIPGHKSFGVSLHSDKVH